MHLHFLQEVKAADTAEVRLRILGLDRKRIHLGLELTRAGKPGVAAAAEVMLLHVRQSAGQVATAPLPEPVAAALAALQSQSEVLAAEAPGSRRMALVPAAPPP